MAPLSPELRADAEHVLEDAGCQCTNVIAVNPDSILYENRMHCGQTVWLHRQKGGRLKVWRVDGFPAWPPEGWHD